MAGEKQPGFLLKDVGIPGDSKIANNEHHNRTQGNHNQNSGITSHLPLSLQVILHNNNQRHSSGRLQRDSSLSRNNNNSNRHYNNIDENNKRSEIHKRDGSPITGATATNDGAAPSPRVYSWLKRHWLLIALFLSLLIIPPTVAVAVVLTSRKTSHYDGSSSNFLVGSLCRT
jgi:hypothetical protein